MEPENGIMDYDLSRQRGEKRTFLLAGIAKCTTMHVWFVWDMRMHICILVIGPRVQ